MVSFLKGILNYSKMLHKIFPDREKAKSIFKMVLERERYIKSSKIDYTNIVVENYYEIIKELATAILLLDGIKAVGENAHKEIIDSLKRYIGLSDEYAFVLQDLRLKRNKSMYEGKQIDMSYLENNKDFFIEIADKLKKIVKDRLK